MQLLCYTNTQVFIMPDSACEFIPTTHSRFKNPDMYGVEVRLNVLCVLLLLMMLF